MILNLSLALRSSRVSLPVSLLRSFLNLAGSVVAPDFWANSLTSLLEGTKSNIKALNGILYCNAKLAILLPEKR